jgi:hypothetical protein
MRTHPTDMRWVWRGAALALLVIGWLFIAFVNNFHISPPVVFIGLGYLATIVTIWNLWQIGVSAVASNEEDAGDADWGRPMGARGELEREKRTLLKAIKEAEFDHLMGKLSDADADKMIQTYRARAIQVIRELEEPGMRGTVRDAIEREVRVRLEVEAHRRGPAKQKRKSKKATEAAVKAARAAAAVGAPGQVAAAMAAAAAQAAEDEEAKEALAAHEAGEPIATEDDAAASSDVDAAKTDAVKPDISASDADAKPDIEKRAEPEAAEPEAAEEAAEPEAAKEASR